MADTSSFLQHPIFLYSAFCQYCKQFAEVLNDNGIDNLFRFVSIDVDPETGSRPEVFYAIQSSLQTKITEVPTVILDEGQYVLSGEEAFKWLQFTIENKNNVGPSQPQQLHAYNPLEMGSFSDPYANIDCESIHDAKLQSFKFINKEDERIVTPLEEKIESKAPPQTARPPQFKHAPKPDIDFGSNRFGYAGQSSSRMDNNKSGSIDARLQQLLAEREATVPTPPQRE